MELNKSKYKYKGACAHTIDGFFNDDIFDTLYRIFDIKRGGYHTVDFTGNRAVVRQSHTGFLSLAEVAFQLGITQERVRQIENKALKKLRLSRKVRALKDFI